jgi:hypothetical protein
MGWSFSCDPAHTRAKQVEKMRQPGYLSTGYKMLVSTAIGNNFWYLFTTPDNVTMIGLTLMKGGGRGYGWGEKGMSEDWGPTEVNCPLSYLKLAGPPVNDNARDWRERVVAFHAAKAARPEPHTGMVVEYGDRQYRLTEVHWKGPRSGWCAVGIEDGQGYRIKAHQLRQAKVVNT